MSQLILDVMSGDRGPDFLLRGANQALCELSHCCFHTHHEFILVGDENIIHPLLKKWKLKTLIQALKSPSSHNLQARIVHTTEALDPKDTIRAIRNKPNATINIGCELATRSHSQTPSAFISAGHTGAIMASALLQMGRLPHIERPALAVKLPTWSGHGCILIDGGANVDCKPEHLRNFAIMGALYAQLEQKSKRTLPRIALLSNGHERHKGNELTRASAILLEETPVFKAKNPHAIGLFQGYLESHEIFQGHADVIVTDGFVGNIVLKSLENLGSVMTPFFKAIAYQNPFTSLGYRLAAKIFSNLKKKLDYAEYGAAPLLGVNGYVFICHGHSNVKAIKNALLLAHTATQMNMLERLEKTLLLAQTKETPHSTPQGTHLSEVHSFHAY